jgi:hypothetical protein
MKTKNQILLASAIFFVGLTNARAQTTFTKITTGAIVNDNADGLGCTWVDFDKDGYLDLSVAGDNTPDNLFYRNDRKGGFIPVTITPSVAGNQHNCTVLWADIDNDGRLDLFLGNFNGAHALFRQLADGTFTRTTVNGGSGWGAAAAADYDNDGLVDLFTVGSGGRILWHNNGQGGFTAASNFPATAAGAFSVTWADYDNDRRPDLFLACDGGNSQLFHNDGNGSFSRITTGPLVTDGGSAKGAAWADYDNDGFLDVMVSYGVPGGNTMPPRLYHNNGNGTFTRVLENVFNDSVAFISFTWGDYDNDGWIDLFMPDYHGGGGRLYHNNGDDTFTKVSAGTVTSDSGRSVSAVWGDYDRDGFLDLFVSNSAGGPGDSSDYLYHNNGNSNSWIEIKCVGTLSNRSAIGAKVRIKTAIAGKTFWQMREINTGDGRSGGLVEAHFGLGQVTNAEVVRIEWPSGTVQEFDNVPAKQVLTIVEPSRLVASMTSGVLQLLVQGGRGLQYRIEASTDLATWSPIGVAVITNIDGTATFADTNAQGFSKRFYRAVLP